jgi:hypothetical protein
MLDPRDALAAVDELLKFARGRVVKATAREIIARRDAYLSAILPDVIADLADYFDAQAGRVLSRVTKADDLVWDPEAVDWQAEENELRKLLLRWYASIGVAGYEAAAEQLVIELRWDLANDGVRALIETLGNRIAGITDTSRLLVRELVVLATERGYSVAELVAGVEADSFPGLGRLIRSWGSSTGRALLIARTETATAWNGSTIAAYRDSGLIDMVHVFDGTKDAECAAANGSEWTLDEAEGRLTQHPACQRAFSAVVAR